MPCLAEGPPPPAPPRADLAKPADSPSAPPGPRQKNCRPHFRFLWPEKTTPIPDSPQIEMAWGPPPKKRPRPPPCLPPPLFPNPGQLPALGFWSRNRPPIFPPNVPPTPAKKPDGKNNHGMGARRAPGSFKPPITPGRGPGPSLRPRPPAPDAAPNRRKMALDPWVPSASRIDGGRRFPAQETA